jgi:Schlafen, AlbA_2
LTIFGVPWSELELEHVKAFLDQADDEPLLWEAKGTALDKNEVRRQVCGFANSHDGGDLILGAVRSADGTWSVEGVPFPGGEPPTWVATIVGDAEKGVRPRSAFDVRAWPAANGHVAVVHVRPTPTPPCIFNGTVYERLPGKTDPVREPMRLADLYARGERAHRFALDRADAMADFLMDRLEGDAGTFDRPWSLGAPQDSDVVPSESDYIRFSVGVAATGNPSNISGRLFKDGFAEEIWHQLRDRPTGLPQEFFGNSPDAVEWSQDALMWRHQMQEPINSITLARASWDGAGGAAQKLATEDAYIDSLAERRLAPLWKLADDLVARLGGFGDVYLSVRLAGGSFPRRQERDRIVLRRGPLLPGVDDEHVASLGRELMRALGSSQPEP